MSRSKTSDNIESLKVKYKNFLSDCGCNERKRKIKARVAKWQKSLSR